MAGGCPRCCFAVGVVLVVSLAVLLYPLSQWDENVTLKTRLTAVVVQHVLPSASFNLCTLVAWLTGTDNFVASRTIMSTLGSLAALEGVSVENLEIAGVPVRLYRPSDIGRDEVLPVLIYYHGGGYVTGSLNNYDAYCATFCTMSKMAVVSVDYRLAPEHVFPAAFDDCFAVTSAIVGDIAVATQLAVNSSLVSIGGDSAGGSLTVAMALHVSRTDLPPLRSQVAIFPSIRYLYVNRSLLSSYSAPGGLSPEGTFYFRSHFIGGYDGYKTLNTKIRQQSPELLPPDTWKNATLRVEGSLDVELEMPPAERYPYAKTFLSDALIPLLATDLDLMAPAIIILAGIDPLYEDGLVYERRLKSAGVDAEVYEYPYQIHGFTAFVPTHINVWGLEIPLGNEDALDSVVKSVEFVQRHT